jgi:putative membrane protein
MMEYLDALPSFFAYLGMGAALTALFLGVYLVVTPQRELGLIRTGNVSAALVMIGALFGYIVPLASAIAHSVSLLDLAIWGGVALMVQLVTYLLLRWWLHDLRAHIEADRVAVALLAASVSLAVGVLNAAAMTY